MHLARRARRAARRRRRPAGARSPAARSSRTPTGSAGPGWTPERASGTGVRPREEAARGLPADEDLWCAGRVLGRARRPGRRARGLGWAGDLADRAAAGRGGRRGGPAGAGPWWPQRSRMTTSTPAGAGRRRVHRRRPRRGGRLPVVRGLVARHHDVLRGPVPGHRPRRRGPRLLRGYAATLSEGMLANTADTGRTEYNTADGTLWFLHALGRHVAATGDIDLAAELLPGARRHRRRAPRGHPLRHRGRPGRRPADPGRDGLALTWMDAPHRRRAGHAAHRQGRRDRRAVGQRAAGARRAAEPPAATPTELRRRCAQGRPPPSGARSAPDGGLLDVVDGPDGDDAAVRARTSCSPLAARRAVRAAGPAAPRGGAAPADPARACAPSRPARRATRAGTAAARPSATPPTTRARSGRG